MDFIRSYFEKRVGELRRQAEYYDKKLVEFLEKENEKKV
jgi:hypothetical protein